MTPEYKEIVKYLMIDEDFRPVDNIGIYNASIKLDKRKLKLLKDLHGSIGVKEFLAELTDKIYSELEMDTNV